MAVTDLKSRAMKRYISFISLGCLIQIDSIELLSILDKISNDGTIALSLFFRKYSLKDFSHRTTLFFSRLFKLLNNDLNFPQRSFVFS